MKHPKVHNLVQTEKGRSIEVPVVEKARNIPVLAGIALEAHLLES